MPTDASAPARPLTSGARDSAPAFSPDGRWLAYLSAEPGGKPQVHLLPTAGGAPRRLSDQPLGAGGPVWSPDSRRLAWVARVPEQGRYGTAEGVGSEAEPPRLITSLQVPARTASASCSTGPATSSCSTCRPTRRRRRAAARSRCRSPTGTPTTPTSPGARTAPSWPSSPPGTSGPTATWCATCYAVRPDGSGLRRITESRSGLRAARLVARRRDRLRDARSPISGRTASTSSPARPLLCRVPAGGGAVEPVLDPEEHDRGDETPATVVTADGVLFGVQRRGAVELLRVPLDGGSPETLVDGRVHRPRRGRPGAASSSRPSRTTAPPGSWSRSRRAAAGCSPRSARQLAETGRLHRDGGADGDRAGRLPGARLDRRARGEGPHPVLLTDPRRPVRPVRLDAVRRDPDLRLGRLRRRPVQPARLVGLRAGARPGHPAATWARRGRRRRRSPSSTPRSEPPARRRPGRRHGRLLRRLHDDAADRPHHDRFTAAIMRAGVQRSGQLRRLLRHRLVLPRRLPRHRPRADRRAEPAGRRATGSPRRRW